PLRKLDLVGPFEQPFMNIACVPSDVIPKLTTHIEVGEWRHVSEDGEDICGLEFNVSCQLWNNVGWYASNVHEWLLEWSNKVELTQWQVFDRPKHPRRLGKEE